MAAVIALSAMTTTAPITVLEEPDPISLSLCYSFSFVESGIFRSYSMRTNGKKKQQHGFWSWNNKKKNESSEVRKARTNDAGWGMSYLEGLDLAAKGCPSCSGAAISSSSSTRLSSTMKRRCGDHGEYCKVSISRMRDRSHATSHLWENIYGSLKHVVPWRKRS